MELLEKTNTPAPSMRELVIADRCDRCGARAYTIARKSDGELLFCGHHGRAHEPALIGDGWEVEFQLYQLEPKDE